MWGEGSEQIVDARVVRNTFVISLDGRSCGAILHSMDGKVDRRSRLLVLQLAKRSMGLSLACCDK